MEQEGEMNTNEKLREALDQIAYIVRMFDDIDNVRDRVKQVMANVKDIPRRNCDVGTA